MLLLSKFRLLAPWAAFLTKVVKTWTSEVEMTLWLRKPPPGRSAFLLWAVAGAQYHPLYAINAARYAVSGNGVLRTREGSKARRSLQRLVLLDGNVPETQCGIRAGCLRRC